MQTQGMWTGGLLSILLTPAHLHTYIHCTTHTHTSKHTHKQAHTNTHTSKHTHKQAHTNTRTHCLRLTLCTRAPGGGPDGHQQEQVRAPAAGSAQPPGARGTGQGLCARLCAGRNYGCVRGGSWRWLGCVWGVWSQGEAGVPWLCARWASWCCITCSGMAVEVGCWPLRRPC